MNLYCYLGADYRGDLRAQGSYGWLFTCSWCEGAGPSWLGDEVSDCCPDCGGPSLYRDWVVSNDV